MSTSKVFVLSVLLSLFYNIQLLGQIVPLFSTAFYFEDAHGNRDTCVVGYDPNATLGIDTAFGEQILPDPFDSVFEVRTTYHTDLWTLDLEYLSKYFITASLSVPLPNQQPVEYCTTGSVGMPVFLIKSRYPPVRVSWDRNAFRQSDCDFATALWSTILWQILFPPFRFEYPDMACVAVDSSYLLDYANIDYEINGFDYYYHAFYPSLSDGVDTLFGLKLSYGRSVWDSPVACLDSAAIFLPQKEVLIDETNSWASLSPNPAATFIKITGESGVVIESWVLYDLQGKQLGHGKSQSIGGAACFVPVAELSPGMYAVLLTTKNGKAGVKRFVKL